MSHTPGPWKVADHLHVWTADEVGCEVAVVCSENLDDDGLRQAEADARLIAAAPELLAAMKAAVSEISGWDFSTTPDPGDTDFVLECKRIIAKAEGGA